VRLPAIHATVAEGVEGLTALLKEGSGAAPAEELIGEPLSSEGTQIEERIPAAGSVPAEERILGAVFACKFLILSEDLGAGYEQKMLFDRCHPRKGTPLILFPLQCAPLPLFSVPCTPLPLFLLPLCR